MFTILDYVKYYKGSSLKKINFNIMDNLVCALLSYMPSKEFQNKTLVEMLEEYINSSNLKEMKPFHKSLYNLAKALLSSKRYNNAILKNFVNIRNEQTQFGALTIIIDDKKIISFKGTDNSIIGWLENFRLSYSYPTYTQKLALIYALENIKESDQNVYLVGHSKGGNLATFVGMEINDTLFEKIKNIYSFDGPGFRLEEFLSDKFKRVSKKVINIIPTGSYVGTIMYNKKPEVVKTNKIALNEHYPTNWIIFGEFFYKGEQTSSSKQINENTTVELMKLDKKLVETTIEIIFKTLNKNYSENIKIGVKDLINIFNRTKKIDPKVNDYFEHLFTSLIKSIYK